MKKLVVTGVLIVVCVNLFACGNPAVSEPKSSLPPDINIRNWDNSKYERMGKEWGFSIGLAVDNNNSFTEIDSTAKTTYNDTNTLFIDDINKPVSLKFNSNGRNRNLVVTVFYDYVQIPFKISASGEYGSDYKFGLAQGKEIELPLYLPQDLEQDGSHKLLVSFVIGYDLNAGDFDEPLTWYGQCALLDVIYKKSDLGTSLNESVNFFDVPDIVDVTYDFTLNQDNEHNIVKTKILTPMPVKIDTSKGETIKLTYNASSIGEDAVDFLVILTVDFNQAKINENDYELIRVPKGHTGIMDLSIVAPEIPGQHEVFAYLIYSPFEPSGSKSKQFLQFSQRFTLDVN